MSRPAVSVVVVAYQSAAVLERCLQQLGEQTFRAFEVLLVDNGSTDGAVAAAVRGRPHVTVIDTGANLGFAEANNIAAARASGDWLALLNPDAFAHPDWLERLMAATAAHPEVDCFTSLQRAAGDLSLLDGAGDAMTLMGLPYRMGWRRPAPAVVPDGEVFAPCGAAMMIRRETFLALGGFERRFFSYCEDADLGYRLRLSGGRTRLVADAVVEHVGSSTLGARSEFAVYHGVRNRLWCFARNTPGVILPLALPLHAAATLIGLAAAVMSGRGRATLRGLRDGLGEGLAMRREQAGRRGHVHDVLAALTWDPIKAARRGLDIRSPSAP